MIIILWDISNKIINQNFVSKSKFRQKLTGDWLNTLGPIHKMEYYTALKWFFQRNICWQEKMFMKYYWVEGYH